MLPQLPTVLIGRRRHWMLLLAVVVGAVLLLDCADALKVSANSSKVHKTDNPAAGFSTIDNQDHNDDDDDMKKLHTSETEVFSRGQRHRVQRAPKGGSKKDDNTGDSNGQCMDKQLVLLIALGAVDAIMLVLIISCIIYFVMIRNQAAAYGLMEGGFGGTMMGGTTMGGGTTFGGRTTKGTSMFGRKTKGTSMFGRTTKGGTTMGKTTKGGTTMGKTTKTKAGTTMGKTTKKR